MNQEIVQTWPPQIKYFVYITENEANVTNTNTWQYFDLKELRKLIIIQI
jgi:hypothetical protein